MGYVARPKVLKAKQGGMWAGHMGGGKGHAVRNEKTGREGLPSHTKSIWDPAEATE